MNAKEWLKYEYFDSETGDWYNYDIYEVMENYHNYKMNEENGIIIAEVENPFNSLTDDQV